MTYDYIVIGSGFGGPVAARLLVGAGVLQEVGEGRRDRSFCAAEISTILEEPTRLEEEPL